MIDDLKLLVEVQAGASRKRWDCAFRAVAGRTPKMFVQMTRPSG